VVAVDLVHSERMVSADGAGLTAETVTLDGMAARMTLSTEEVKFFFRSEDIFDDMSLL
jgi:hypothetical protein